MLPRNFRELTSACTPFPTFLGYFLSYAFSVGSNLFNQVIFLKQPLTNIFSICKIKDRLFQKILNLSNEPNSWRTYWCVFIWNFELTLKCILLPNRKNDIVFLKLISQELLCLMFVNWCRFPIFFIIQCDILDNTIFILHLLTFYRIKVHLGHE